MSNEAKLIGFHPLLYDLKIVIVKDNSQRVSMATNGKGDKMFQFSVPQPNPALYTTEDHRIYLNESPALRPGPNDCVVHVRTNGICGSDLHFWKHGSIGECIVTSDYVLGHEGAGAIEWVGENVKHLAVGDRVAIEPGVPCRKCTLCTRGEYNLCREVKFTGAPPYDGSIRRYHVHDAEFLHKLPEELSFSDGALLEPLSVVMHAFERSPIRLGEPTLICGAGPIGLIALGVARVSGAFPLVITDVDPRRLAFAQQMYPGCQTYQVQLTASPMESAAEITHLFVEALGVEQPRVVYECTGVQSSINTAAFAAARGGEVMVVGVGRPMLDQLPFMHISMSEIDIKFINRYHHTWPSAIRLLQSKYIDLKPLVTHTVKLEDAASALEMVADPSQFTVKVHIVD